MGKLLVFSGHEGPNQDIRAGAVGARCPAALWLSASVQGSGVQLEPSAFPALAPKIHLEVVQVVSVLALYTLMGRILSQPHKTCTGPQGAPGWRLERIVLLLGAAGCSTALESPPLLCPAPVCGGSQCLPSVVLVLVKQSLVQMWLEPLQFGQWGQHLGLVAMEGCAPCSCEGELWWPLLCGSLQALLQEGS